jgi:hypothetical protein
MPRRGRGQFGFVSFSDFIFFILCIIFSRGGGGGGGDDRDQLHLND